MKQIEEARTAIWQSLSKAQQRAYESYERIRRELEIIDRVRKQVQIARTGGHVIRRNQEGASGKGRKSSVKRSTKSASGSSNGGGGGGDGDGDGPKRTSFKKRRPYQNRNTSSAHPPSIPTGEITSLQLPSPHSPPQSPPRGRGLATYLSLLGALFIALTAKNEVLGILVFAIIALCVTGHSDVAKTALTSKAITDFIARLSAKAGDE